MQHSCMMHDKHTSLLTLVPLARNVAPASLQQRPVKRNTKAKGILSELAAMERFYAAGFALMIPFGDAAPYDIVLDDLHDHLYRIQVKTGRLRRGVVLWNCCSHHWHRNARPTYYNGRIEAFAIYCPDNDELYVVPINAPPVTLSYGSLRISPARNNNSKLVHWAKDYRFDESNAGALLAHAFTESQRDKGNDVNGWSRRRGLNSRPFHYQ